MPDILRFDRRHQSGVREGRVTPRERHPVDHHLPVLGRCRDDPAARAHAKGMYPPIVDLRRQSVASGGQQVGTRRALGHMVLLAVDKRLRMLDPKPDRERLVLHQDALFGNQPVDVSRGVPRGKNGRIGQELAAIRRRHAPDFPSGNQQVSHLRLKVHLPAVVDHRLPHRFHHIWQKIRTDVRVRIRQDFFRRTVRHQHSVNLRHRSAFLRPCVEFPIGKRPGSALAEAIVRFRNHPPLTEDGSEIESPCRGILAPLQHDGFCAHLQAFQRRKKPRRPRSDDQHPLRVFRQRWSRPHRFLLFGQILIHRHLQAQLHFHLPLTGIDGVLA